MNKIHFLNLLNDPEENRKMLNKLPNYLVNRWGRIVDKRIGEEFSDQSDDEDETRKTRRTDGISYPSFAEFSRFLKKEARIACNTVTSQCFLKREDVKKTVEKERSSYKQSRYRNIGVKSFASQIKPHAPEAKENNGVKERRTIVSIAKKRTTVMHVRNSLKFP